VLRELGDPAGARACWERALAIYTTTYGTGYRRARQVEQALEQLDSDHL
jgi:hypothetical protein